MNHAAFTFVYQQKYYDLIVEKVDYLTINQYVK